MKLIEKLEKERQRLNRQANNDMIGGVGSKESHSYMVGLVGGLTNAIKIVEQHSKWVSVKECLPPEEIKLLFEHEDYGVVIGYYRDRGEFVTYDIHYNYRDSIDKFLKWCYIPTNEVDYI